MVKYGKLFRELQIDEFKDKYINYKKLKQKIKEIEKRLPRTSQKLIKNRESNISNLKLRPTISSDFDETESGPTTDQYGEQLKEFQKLLDEEFMRCYMYFKKIRKQLHSKINVHLYTQTNYISYTLDEILKEVNNLRNTTYLAKSLNAFINDNMMAIKKILKKFDKKFSNYFGNIGPKYILDNLSKQNSDLEYLLQFKIIDETSCICESNLKLLTECYREINNSNRINNDNENDFEQKARQITEYLKDIDELIYFKIQYKEWFYYSKKNASIISNSKLFNNLMFNPILFSAYHKDDLCNKFLSRKDALKEIEQLQPSISLYNLINIILIFIHTFFYNTLISGIYPLLFEYMGELYDKKYLPYSLLIIASTYFFSYFSIIIYHYFGSRSIKLAYLLSYIIFLLGSIVYIIKYRDDPDNPVTLVDFSIMGYLIFSRILIGLGAIPTLGKKYILSYTPKYYLPFISKIYYLFSIIGHSVGPLIGFILYNLKNITFLHYFYISKYNCIGWYGLIMSFILLIIHLILFTSPYSSKFSRVKGNNTKVHYGTFTSQDSQFLIDDIDDNQDKEFYRLQKEMKVKKIIDNESDLNDDLLLSYKENNDNLLKRNFSLSEEEQSIQDNEDTRSEGKNGDATKINQILRKSNTLSNDNKINDDSYNSDKANYDKINPLFISTNFNSEIKDESQQESTSFVHINMIPRTIEDLIRKEKKTFGYLNKNLLIILIILFFNNLLKENFIAYCSYYIYYSITFVDKNKGYIPEQYLSCLISLSYFLEILSMPFILPFYKLNTQIKKLLIALMIITILLMIPLSIENVVDNIIIYFVIISLVFLISSIIEVLSSCYLAYLTPPEWKFSRFNAGALPLYVMTFGKFCGCLICFIAFTSKLLLNHHIIISLTILGYGISGIFILKSKNFRIKAIARIMRKTELEQGIF